MVITLTRLARAALIGLAAFSISRGFSYISFANGPADDLPGAIKVFNVPVTVWVVMWFAVGAATAAATVKPWPWGYLPSIFTCLLWTCGYVFAFINTEATAGRSLTSAVLYLVVAEFATIGFLLTGRRMLHNPDPGDE